MRSMPLLFESPETARAVVFRLQCEYDGCTMMTVPSIHDTLALRTAIVLTGAACCFAGDPDPLVLSLTTEAVSQVRDQQVGRMSRKAA
jgi:hypothetical protein